MNKLTEADKGKHVFIVRGSEVDGMVTRNTFSGNVDDYPGFYDRIVSVHVDYAEAKAECKGLNEYEETLKTERNWKDEYAYYDVLIRRLK